MNYDVTIGIEIHLELKTKTKMFSSAPSVYASQANSACTVIDLAHPGTLPTVNKEAVRKAILACLAFDLKIDNLIRFDRKNYYYSDLPKGYQITQQFYPIGKDGKLEFEVDGENYIVGIERIHMEEDTAKQFHLENETLIDFNRAGTPLIEIVSKPDMTSGKQARAYLENLRRNLVYIGVSDAKMEEGSMRCDVNISLKPKGSKKLGTKVEIKNLNSINNVEKAIEYEILRQSTLLDNNELVTQSTRRYDENSKETILMRKKEGVVDYKFFPEPNIPIIKLEDKFINDLKLTLPELVNDKKIRYQNEYHLDNKSIEYLLDNILVANYFEEIVKLGKNYKVYYNFITSELMSILNADKININESKISPNNLFELINLIENKEISNKQAKEILLLMKDGTKAKVIVEEKGYKQNSDDTLIKELVNQVLAQNEQSIIDYHNGKDKALGFIVGQVMKLSKGQANPALTSQIVKEEFIKRKP